MKSVTRLLGTFALLASVATISACSNLGTNMSARYTETEPSLKDMTEYGVVYKGSFIDSKDFLADGSLKTMEDYDFTVESAPCTVIDDQFQAKDAEHVYTVNRGGKDFNFVCRGKAYKNRTEHRLFLMGSRMECRGRSWNYSPAASAGGAASQLGLMCTGRRGGKTPNPVEVSYMDALRSEIH